jgi:tol-pal system protein YbgF
MKKKYLTSLLLLVLLPLLSNCASQNDVKTLNYHVRSINKKLDDMKVNTVDQMQQRQADSSGILDQMQADILVLKSKLEENSHMNRMLQEQNKELQLAVQNLQTKQEKKMDSTIAELNSKIALQNESLAAIQQARVREAERRSKAASIAAADAMRRAQAAKVAKVTAANKAAASNSRSTGIVHIQAGSQKVKLTPTTTVPATNVTKQSTNSSRPVTKNTTAGLPPKPVQDSFSKAQQQYRNGKYKDAYTLFEKSASNRSDQTMAINSRYMMGECLYKQNQYDQAIIQYQQIISNYPGKPEAAKALFRQGESFEQLSDNETAKIIYTKLTKSYSSSPEAASARKRIEALQ